MIRRQQRLEALLAVCLLFSTLVPVTFAQSPINYEGELFFAGSPGNRVQGMSHYGNQWSRSAHLLWEGEPGKSTSIKFRVRASHLYRLTVYMTRAVDYGIFQLHLDGKPIGKLIDLYSTKVDRVEHKQGEFFLEKGRHELKITLAGSNPKAKPYKEKYYLAGLDNITLTPLPEGSIPVAETKPLPPAPPPPAIDLAQAREILAEHCFRCHGDKEKVKGKVHLKQMATREHFLKDINLTRTIIDALEAHEMPPEDEKQPSSRSRENLVTLFRSYVAEYLETSGDFEPVVMRRLNRYEYNNAVRDLLQLKGDIYPLPEKVIRASGPYYDPASGHFPDAMEIGNRPLGKFQVEQQILEGVVPFAVDLQSEHGFNNRGDELSLSPILLESFLQLSQSIVNNPSFNNYCKIYQEFFEPQNNDPTSHSALARQRLEPFLEQAFRDSIDEATLARYLAFFDHDYAESNSFSATMKKVVSAILSSPRFLYMVESNKKPDAPISDYELATRLSFFLWSSIPDDTLLTLARQDQLHEPAILRQQVNRLLKDPRSQSLSQNFARQWLRLDQLITAVPDMERFPIYYSRIGCEQWKFGLQTMIEPLLLFESILVEDGSILLLIDADYSYRSDELQSWYQSGVPFGNKSNRGRFNTNRQLYKRRELADRRQGGVISSAATLTMTSAPLRTSPITRGAWVATVIFNDPPPPPPDSVPEIEADDAVIEAKGLTLRQRLKAHQENESCVSCHAKIDPLGFVLENFDAVGRWRDTYRSGLKIDTTGKLFGQTEFTDIITFKDALLKHSDKFIVAFTEHLLSYALGRELTVADEPVVEQIAHRVQANGNRISTLITEIATSAPFLK